MIGTKANDRTDYFRTPTNSGLRNVHAAFATPAHHLRRRNDDQLRYFTAPCASKCSMSLFTLRIKSDVAVQNTGLVMQW